jgi:ABC-type branched-subunit amino acid transport system substrate-binding protein
MSGLDTQARAFIDYMSKTDGLKGRNIGIVHTNIERDVSVIAAVKDQTKKNGMNAVLSYPFIIGTIEAAGIVKQLRAANRDLVFFLGPADDALLLIKEAERVGWFPRLFLGGALALAYSTCPWSLMKRSSWLSERRPRTKPTKALRNFLS